MEIKETERVSEFVTTRTTRTYSLSDSDIKIIHNFCRGRFRTIGEEIGMSESGLFVCVTRNNFIKKSALEKLIDAYKNEKLELS